MKTYVLTLSKLFPSTHPRAGEITDFKDKFLIKQKIHTIRANYQLWRDRIEEINNGRACLSIRQWTGKPYRSKQVEIARLTKEDGIGIEEVVIRRGTIGESKLIASIDGMIINEYLLAANDGLDFYDWCSWFEEYDLSKSMAIIHFTNFRYAL